MLTGGGIYHENHLSQNLCATASVLIGLGAMSSAQADFFAGNLGAGASATDVYAVACPLLPAPSGNSAWAQMTDNGAADGIEVSVQVVNPHGRAINATAPDGGAFSPFVELFNQ